MSDPLDIRLPEAPFEAEGVPERALRIYARLWQFETWLRHMIYVELRALLGDDWSQSIQGSTKSLEADKYLTHMSTPEMNALSYSQLRALTGLVKAHWECFKPYFPPLELWEGKLKEIFQIRHRAAHFRIGHADDYARLRQFLRDIDPGFWKFCTSYNDPRPILPQDRDPVTAHFLPLDPLPWGEVDAKRWARIGMVDASMVIGVTIEALHRPWSKRTVEVAGKPGHLYDVRLIAMDRRRFDYSKLLELTEPLHVRFAHMCLSSFEGSLRVTVPSILGHEQVISLVEQLLEASRYAASRSQTPMVADVDTLADEWPEYVLGPRNPLAFLDPEMKCSFFGA